MNFTSYIVICSGGAMAGMSIVWIFGGGMTAKIAGAVTGLLVGLWVSVSLQRQRKTS